MKKTVALFLMVLAVICVSVSCDSEYVEITLEPQDGFYMYNKDNELRSAVTYSGSSCHNLSSVVKRFSDYSVGTSPWTAVGLRQCQFSLNPDGSSPINLKYRIHGDVTIYVGT